MKKHLATWIVFLTVPNLAFSQPPQAAEVSRELQVYYDNGTPPGWSPAIKKLTADRAEERKAAAAYLTAILEQAQSDELSGKAPWRQTPYWGCRRENPALELRKEIAEELGNANASVETLRVTRTATQLWDDLGGEPQTAFKAVTLDVRHATRCHP